MTVLNQICAAIQKCGDYWANELSNPSAETNVTGWGVQGGTLTRVTTDSRIGAACGENVRTSTTSNIAPVPTGTGAIPCSPGDLLYVLASGKQVGGALPSTPLRLRLQFLDSGGAAVGSSLAVNQQIAAVDTWTDFAALAIVPAGAAFVRPFTDWGAGASVTITIHSDRWSVVRNPLRYSVGDLDDFGADSGTWVDSLTGAALTGYTIASGVYTPTTNASRRAVRSDRIRGDGRYAVRFRTGATLAGAGIALVLKADLAGNYLRLEVTASSGQIAIRRVVGTATALAVVTASALVASTDYWLRAHVVGNLVTMSIWQGSSLGSGTLLSTVSWVLSGADATQFGAGVSGYYGFYHIGGTVTDYTFDDLQYETLTNALPDYFDGDQGAASWEGTAHASRSLLTKYTIAGRLPMKTPSPSQAQTVTPIRAAQRVLAAAQGQSSPLTRFLARTAALTQAQTGSLVRSAGRIGQAAEAAVAAVVRAPSRVLSSTGSSQPALVRVTSRALSSTGSNQAKVVRVAQRIWSATAPAQPRLVRSVSRVRAVAETVLGVIAKASPFRLSATSSTQARALRAPNPTTRAGQLQSAAVRRSPGAVRSALESTLPKIPRRLTVSRAGVEATSARPLRRPGIVRQAATASSAMARRGPTPRTRATQSTLGRIDKRPGKLAQVLVRVTTSLVRSSSALRAVLAATQAQTARISRAPIIRRLGTSSTTARALRSPTIEHAATQAQVPRALRGPTPRTRATQAQAAARRALAVKALKRAIAAVPTSSRAQLRTAALTQPAATRVIRSGQRVYLIIETGTASTAKQPQRRRTLALTAVPHLIRALGRVAAIVVSLRRALGRVPSIARTSSASTTASTPRSQRRTALTTAATSARVARRPGRSRTASQTVLAVSVRSAGKLARRAVVASPSTRRALQRSLAIAENAAVRLARGRFLQLSAAQPQVATRSRRAGLALRILQAADALRMTFGLPRPFDQPGQAGHVTRPQSGSALSGPASGHVERVRSGRAETIEVP